MTTFRLVVELVAGAGVIGGAAAWLIRSLRLMREGIKCQLRSEMLRIYYKHREEDRLRQYEKENFLLLYGAYKKLGGNSFIDDVAKEVRTWEVVT